MAGSSEVEAQNADLRLVMRMISRWSDDPIVRQWALEAYQRNRPPWLQERLDGKRTTD